MTDQRQGTGRRMADVPQRVAFTYRTLVLPTLGMDMLLAASFVAGIAVAAVFFTVFVH